MKAKRARKGTRAFGRGVRKRGRFVYVVRGGRVRAVAVTTSSAQGSPADLRAAGLR